MLEVSMKPTDIDFAKLRKPLEEALHAYEDILSNKLHFQEFPDLALTPDKPNTARTIVPVKYNCDKVGDLYLISFFP